MTDSKINWQEIDKTIEDNNRYQNLREKIKELKEYYRTLNKNKKFYGR